MPSSLTADEIDQLTSLLGGLARLAAQTPQLSDAQLDTLLLGADLESSIAVQQELKRWSKLLANLRMQPIELYDSVLEALKMRGIPEASARLAAKVVVDGRSNSANVLAKPLMVSVKYLDFGAVPADQVAVAEFTVEGGPGHIVAESDHLTVAPTKFGAGITRIRVEARSHSAAGLWTELKLTTARESIEVPVVAQWEAVKKSAVAPPRWPSAEPTGEERRLPVYILLDASENMAGAPIESVRQGLEQFQREVAGDPFAREVVKVGVIAFGKYAHLLTNGLEPVDVFQIPQLHVSVGVRLDLAFKVLLESIDRDVVRAIPGGHKGDWRPVVYVLIGSRPTVARARWKAARDALVERPKGQIKPSNIVAVGCGPEIDDNTLSAIGTGVALRMGKSIAESAGILVSFTKSGKLDETRQQTMGSAAHVHPCQFD